MKWTTLGSLVAVAAAIAIGGMVTTAGAAMFYNETFSYADGDLVNGTNGPNAPSPPLWAAHSGTGSFVQVSGGTISTTSGSGSRQDVNLPTGSTLGQGETWYAGFDVTISGVTLTGTTEEYFAHFLQGTSNFNSRLYVGAPQAGGGYTLGIRGGSTSPTVTWGSDLTLGQQYRVVVSYTLNPDGDDATQDSFSKLWINPASEASTSVMQVSNFSNSTEAFAFRQGGTAGSGTQVIDNLCVATTFDEAAFCVPEPATLALMGLASLAVVGMARRRS